MSRRIERVNDLLRDEIAALLRQEVKDPRLPMVLSITHVETSTDLRLAKVFVSIMGTPEEGTQAMNGLRSATPFLRKNLRKRLSLRLIPELLFIQDDSIAKSSQLQHILQELEDDAPSH